MDISVVLKIAGLGIIVTVICQMLSKAGRDEQATLVSITGIVIILVIIVDEIGDLLESLKRIFGL